LDNVEGVIFKRFILISVPPIRIGRGNGLIKPLEGKVGGGGYCLITICHFLQKQYNRCTRSFFPGESLHNFFYSVAAVIPFVFPSVLIRFIGTAQEKRGGKISLSGSSRKIDAEHKGKANELYRIVAPSFHGSGLHGGGHNVARVRYPALQQSSILEMPPDVIHLPARWPVLLRI